MKMTRHTLSSGTFLLFVALSDGMLRTQQTPSKMFNSVQNQVEPRACPCAHASLCQRITTVPQHEVFIFSVSNQNWRNYDWTKVTTIALMGYTDNDLVCYAHSKGVRVVSGAGFPESQLANSTARKLWVQEKVLAVNMYFLDGINIDFESEVDQDREDLRESLTLLTAELTTAIKALGDYMQVTFDFAWSPDCIDSRCYDYQKVAEIVDFVFVMAYDERSQIPYECIAWANSPYNNTMHGLERHMEIGIPSEKLVLGIPWYGFRYTCISYNQTNQRCYIAHKPFRGVNCSDAAGRGFGYGIIKDTYLPASFTGRLWDDTAASPYLAYKDRTTGQIYQVWYDDPESLAAKYQLAAKLNLRGVGMWNADSLDYSDPGQVAEMWGILPG